MDIADAEKVIAELENSLEDDSEELDGYVILTSLEDAKCKEMMYNQLADEYMRAADECGILEGILEAAYRHEAEEYRKKAQIETERKEMYQAKVNRYDRIEENTKGCFMESVELRRLAKNTLDGFAVAFLDGEYQPDRMNLYRRELLRCIVSEDRWLESGINLYRQYLTEHVDFPTEEIEKIMDELIVKYPHMLRQLAVLNTYSGNDYQALLSELNIKAQMCALLQTMEGVQSVDIENTETYRILLQSDYA
ncbi:MAG: hypothetical protein J6K26_05210, partial [Lachnospiraceae bacterium]|nr:hypothetical protein [Lachnospiraceae bacterium]